MIKAINTELIYTDGTKALNEVNLHIPSGEIVFITGPSGSGKTSLLKIFMGISKPSSGELYVLGKNMSNISERELRALRRSFGPVFQDFRLLKGRTVFENVMVGMRFLDFNKKEMKENALEAIKRVGLSHKLKSPVDNLSYGERQRVAIARAVARKPKLIIADEPTGNLDKDNSVNILELLKSFRNDNTTIIITTHATHLIENETECIKISVDSGRILLQEAENV